MLRILTNSVMELEKEARECYAGPIDYSPDEFVKILVIDGCFIIELLRKSADVELREENDPIFSMACMLQFLFHDLILLENQVPWMVLEHLFNVVSLIKLLTKFFHKFYFAEPACGFPPIGNTKHILDAFGKLLVSPIGEDKGPDWTLLPSATTLAEAGLKIKRGESRALNNATQIVNLGSLPMLYSWTTSLTLPRTVDILCENKIIKNWLNSEDAIPFFNKLYYNANVKEIYYQSLCKRVNIHCNRRWPRWRAMLVRNYFNTPWAILSTVAAAILLILSFLQTWYATYKK
ncbi:hypothetical protein RGQ29_012036 [Quercus rubra]|uniref:Uncharacterized protein n=1 Tax=Quercus rubra TaxID=3512 RepID=A0AAN7G2J8_QUERU|nr:hypothetical protein RGQ29_012036 [Quercus rubra]